MNPKVVRVVAFNLTDGTELDAAKTCYVECEDGGIEYERIRDILANVFKKEVIGEALGTIRGTSQNKTGEERDKAALELAKEIEETCPLRKEASSR